jgi:hypothetical protein
LKLSAGIPSVLEPLLYLPNDFQGIEQNFQRTPALESFKRDSEMSLEIGICPLCNNVHLQVLICRPINGFTTVGSSLGWEESRTFDEKIAETGAFVSSETRFSESTLQQ